MKVENLLSKKLAKENLKEAEVHKTTMYATNAKRRVTGLTNAEIEEKEERDILLPGPDPDLTLPQTQEEDLREEGEEEEDHTLLPADPLPILEIEEDTEERDQEPDQFPRKVPDLLTEPKIEIREVVRSNPRHQDLDRRLPEGLKPVRSLRAAEEVTIRAPRPRGQRAQ